jgi:hypothetical protein
MPQRLEDMGILSHVWEDRRRTRVCDLFIDLALLLHLTFFQRESEIPWPPFHILLESRRSKLHTQTT